MQSSPTMIPCSFCSQSFMSDEMHDCSYQAYTTLNYLANDNRDPEKVFDNIDNLVFEGGGIKGIAYLGVLKELKKARNGTFLQNIKRYGGTSAGSMTALYLALGMDIDTEIDALMSKRYSELLDDGLALKVAVNIKTLWPNYIYKNYSAKDVILSAIESFDYIEELIHSNFRLAAKTISEAFTDILMYYGCKFGKIYTTFMRWEAAELVKEALKWLIPILRPHSPHMPNPPPNYAAPPQATGVAPPQQPQQENRAKAAPEPKPEAKPEAKKKPSTLLGAFHAILNPIVETFKSDAEKDKQGPKNKVLSQAINFRAKQQPDSEEGSELFNEAKMRDIKYYKEQRKKPSIQVEHRSELHGEILHYAIAELLWFIMISQLDAEGLRQELGLFDGCIVREKMIDGAVKQRFEELGIVDQYRPDFTFRQLHSFVDSKGDPLFKKFYLTIFNTSLLRTEIFSVDHTPDVVVTDAVRASMAIPVFFTPMTIRENGSERRIYSKDGKTSKVIKYLDGGVLDNYPIWIFDELKYVMENIPGWEPKKKVFIHNPRTLGFRILETNRIDIYTCPYVDEECHKQKEISTENYVGTFGFLISTLMKATINEHNENEHIYRADCPRTIYVDSLGMSSIAFNLDDHDKDRLEESGFAAVEHYRRRAAKQFLNEGECYYRKDHV